MSKTKNNKSKIDKLKALKVDNPKAESNNDIMAKGVWNIAIEEQKQDVDIAKIIKLNEKLTAENARLLTELDKSKEFSKSFDKSWHIMDRRISELQIENKEFEKELTSIKSKWWYKLMTWG